jgi:3-oxoacyl-[acyl-carrier-protein] synthase II
VVVTGYGAALDGDMESLGDLGVALRRAPFNGNDRSIAERSPAAAALAAAVGHAIGHPATGRLPPPDGRAIVMGTCAAALHEVICFMEETISVGPSLVNPGLFPFTVINAAAGLAAIEHDCRGPNLTLSNGRTSAFDALAYAADLVASGRAQLAFAGGFEGLTGRVNRVLARPAPPAALAGVFVLATEQLAGAMGARACARLLAYAPARSMAAGNATATRDALLATAAALAPGSRSETVTAGAGCEGSLVALLAAVHRLAAGVPEEAGATLPVLLADGDEGWAGIVLGGVAG